MQPAARAPPRSGVAGWGPAETRVSLPPTSPPRIALNPEKLAGFPPHARSAALDACYRRDTSRSSGQTCSVPQPRALIRSSVRSDRPRRWMPHQPSPDNRCRRAFGTQKRQIHPRLPMADSAQVWAVMPVRRAIEKPPSHATIG